MFMLNPKLYEEAFPINKVEVFFDALDHSNFLGFKWQQVGKGRVPVGLDTSDSDFNTVGKMGGSKTNSHHHSKFSDDAVNPPLTTVNGVAGNYVVGAGNDTGNTTISILQPYIVMAFWKRIA